MKNKSPLIYAVASLLLGTIVSALAAPPNSRSEPQKASEKAELKLSYDNLKQLIDDLQTKEPAKKTAPPVDAVIRSVAYEFSLASEKSAKVTATFSITTFADGWISLPLLSSRYAVQSIEPATTVLTANEGKLSLLTKGAAEHQIAITFLLHAEQDSSFQLPLLAATSGKILATNLTGYSVHGAEPSSENTYILPIEGGVVSIAPTRKSDVVKPSTWSADSRVIYVAADSELQAQAQIQLMAKLGDSAISSSLLLPKDSRIIEAIGPDLTSWKKTQLNGNQIIHLTWKTHGISRRRVTLIYTLPLLDPEETWTLSIPRLKDETLTRGLLALVTPQEFQLTPVGDILRLDPSMAPDWMKQHGRPLILKLPQARSVQFTGKRLAQIQAATATIKSAKFKTQIVTDGSTLTEGDIIIQHRDPKLFTFSLPSNSRILTCSVDGTSANPIVLADESLQLSLTTKHKSKTEESKVLISFTSKLEKIQPIEGKLSLALPSTPLFIHELNWQIILPQPYEATALDGNLTFSTNHPNDQTITLVKRLCRNQAAQTDIFYRKQTK